MKKLLTYTLLIIPFLAFTQFRNYSNDFLSIGVDAQGLAMQKAVVATTNDVNASYWNPAGLTQIKDHQGALMYASYFANIASYNVAGYATPIDNENTIAILVIRFGVDDILNTTELIDSNGTIDYSKIQLFSAADYAVNLSYARKLIFSGFSLGGNVKIIRRIIGDFASSWGLGVDIGLQYQKNGWYFGATAKDITTTYNTWSINETEFEKISNAIVDQNQELPETTELTKPKLQLGIAKKLAITRDLHLLTELDIAFRFAKTNDIITSKSVSISPALGFEIDYLDLVYLRGGIGNIQQQLEFNGNTSTSVQPNLGIGISYKGIKLDYALSNIGNTGNALYSNIFSIKFDYSFYR